MDNNITRKNFINQREFDDTVFRVVHELMEEVVQDVAALDQEFLSRPPVPCSLTPEFCRKYLLLSLIDFVSDQYLIAKDDQIYTELFQEIVVPTPSSIKIEDERST